MTCGGASGSYDLVRAHLSNLLKLRYKSCKLFSNILSKHRDKGAGLRNRIIAVNGLASDPLSACTKVVKAAGDFEYLSKSVHLFLTITKAGSQSPPLC